MPKANQQAFDKLYAIAKLILQDVENNTASDSKLPTPLIRKLYEAIEAADNDGVKL